MTIQKHWIVMCDQCGDADAVSSQNVQTKRDINGFLKDNGFKNTNTHIKQMNMDFCSKVCQDAYNAKA